MDSVSAPLLLPGLRPIPVGRPALPRRQAVLSFLAHGILLAALMSLAVPPQKPPPETVLKLEFLPPPPAVTEALPAASLTQAADQPAPAALQAPAPLTLAAESPPRPHRLPPARPRPAPALARGAAVSPPENAARPLAPSAAPAAPTNPPPAAAKAAPPANAIAALEARIRAAVQAALIYPPAARFRHEQGRVRIRFDYQDGQVGSVSVAVPSEAPILDEAAMATVQRAPMPRAPEAIGDRRLSLLVWVNFGLSD